MNVAILIPIYQHMCRKTERSIEQLLRNLGPYQFTLVEPVRGCSDIAAARTELYYRGLETNAQRFLWVDADMMFSQHDAEQVLIALDDPQIAVCGSNYWTRDGSLPCWQPTGKGEVIRMGETGGLYDAHVGFGLTATSRLAPRMLTNVVFDGRLHPFAQCHGAPDEWLPEDRSYCHRVIRAGFRSVVDTRVCPAHLSSEGEVYWWTNQHNRRAPIRGEVQGI